MFGRMNIEKVLQLEPDPALKTAVEALLQATETTEIVRWIEFPKALLLFLLVPGNSESGSIYILDRRKGTWYFVDFDDEQYGGYSTANLEVLLKDCRFLDLVERPGLIRGNLPWVVEPGKQPEIRVIRKPS